VERCLANADKIEVMGRWLIGAGVVLLIAGALVMLAERAGIHLGRLPGDIRIEGKRGGFYFPVVTCILIGVVLSLISWIFRK
jgi:Protein of unknown function (DUF2905)